MQSRIRFVVSDVARFSPVSNRTPKPLFQRILMKCGATTLRGDEEHYLQLLTLYFQRCGVELLIVDEVEHIKKPA